MKESGLPTEMLSKFPHQISGGEKQRIALIRALLTDPILLVLDEPTSSLDISIRKQILDLIKRLIKSRKMFVLFISHDLSVIKDVVDYVFVMRKGSVVEEGEVSQIYDAPKHPYTKELLWSASYFDDATGDHTDHNEGECCP